ncbi:MAG: methylated-DNA--[protein]-cysteine S-methyltransferase [Sphingobacteriaceae bacterium]
MILFVFRIHIEALIYMHYCSTLATPIGLCSIRGTDTHICSIYFDKEAIHDVLPNSITEQGKKELQEYFDLKRDQFTFPWLQKGTDFQQRVWRHLSEIPIGWPISYAKLSEKMNHPLAIRAIASANGKNQLAIVVPCHRVIGSSGNLVGYAGGLWRKKWLLEHEAQLAGKEQTMFHFG